MGAIKFGKCRLCPADSKDQRIYGDGVCAYHLANPGDDLTKKKVAAELLDPDQVKLLQQFYQEQWAIMPRACENCGTHLHAKTLREAKFFICHIVPKKHFKSVMVHPLNRWFGCWQCHSDYDRTWTKAVTMTVWPTVCIRFNEFMSLIKDTELRHLPDALRVLHDKIAPC